MVSSVSVHSHEPMPSRDDAVPRRHALRGSPGRWGRAAMASFFVVGAAISIAANEPSWSRVASGSASPLDWLYVISAIGGAVSGFVFAAGRATVPISLGWIAYCVITAFAAYPFWIGGPDVADHATGFMSHIAVAASLALYITHTEARG
jgi:uncharacterized membrane protein YphA (DoxX/SURF4 family)